jgi:hypothetical protein
MALGKANIRMSEMTDTPSLSSLTGSEEIWISDSGISKKATVQSVADLGGGGLSNITETLHTSAPNDTINAEQLEVTGGSTNVDLVLTPKGTGAFIVGPEPDGTSTGGNKRGQYAVDLQIVKSNAIEVAGGNYSFAAGRYNRPTGENATAIGFGNVASGASSVALGPTSNASGSGAAALVGGIASGENSFAVGSNSGAGGRSSIALGEYGGARTNMIVHSGYGVRWGNHQTVFWLASQVTTNNTPTAMTVLDALGEKLTITSGRVSSFHIQIVGIKSDGSTVARYSRQVTIKNVSGTTSLVGGVTILGSDEPNGTSISITEDDTNDALKIEVTGIASETWRWYASLWGPELAYGT